MIAHRQEHEHVPRRCHARRDPAERAHFTFPDDRLLTTVGVGEDRVGSMIVVDPRTLDEQLVDDHVLTGHPQELRRLEHLGATKLYMLAPLDPSRRRELTGRVPLVIPGRVVPKTVELMTTLELGRVIEGAFGG